MCDTEIIIINFLRFKSAILTDKRVRIMNEIISGIRVIKMYAWENAFKRVVFDLRRYRSLLTCTLSKHCKVVDNFSLLFHITGRSQTSF